MKSKTLRSEAEKKFQAQNWIMIIAVAEVIGLKL